MKNLGIVKARIKRNKLDELAGFCYRDEHSDIVKYLKDMQKKALLGIQKADGVYTIIGEESVYYSTPLGIEGEISHKDFLAILTKNAMSLGKMAQFEFVEMKNKDLVWVSDVQTMNAMWNTIILLSS